MFCPSFDRFQMGSGIRSRGAVGLLSNKHSGEQAI